MKKKIYPLLFIFLPTLLFSQNYGNEWINYSQQYYKINIHQNGTFRINYSTLLNAGVPVSTINPQNFQIFSRGTEQYIYVEGENDGVFNTNDFIEFYAKKNDGWLDEVLYGNSSNQPNPNHSLFSDTASYYLTWNTSIVNNRMTPENDINFSSFTPASYFYYVSREDYTSDYFMGETNSYGVADPEYTEAEGWFDAAFSLGNTKTKNINTSNAYTSGTNANVKYVVVSESNYSSTSPDHHLKVEFVGLTKDTLYEGYGLHKFNYSVSTSSLGTSSTPFVFTSVNDIGSGAARNTVSYISIKYPHTPNLGNASSFYFTVPDATQSKSRLDISNFNVTTGDAHLYDITNHKRIKVVQNSGNFQMLIPNSGGEKECYLTSDGQITVVTTLLPVSSNQTNLHQFKDFITGNNANSNYIFITHKILWNEVVNYETYRKSIAGGSYKTLLIDIDDLYEQFSYGISKNPLAIRNFIRYALVNFTDTIEHLFLIGKSYTADIYRNNSTYFSNTLVPTFGNPPSDFLLSCGIIDTLWQPAISTGRLSAKTPNDVNIYLDKVQQYELAQKTPDEWMKRIMHFGGGTTEPEQDIFKYYLSQYEITIEDTLFGGNVIRYFKNSTAPIQTNLSDEIKYYINNGVSLMTFFGHAAGIGFDISIDHPSQYQNYGKYPFLLANSCFAGDIFGTGVCSSEEFVLIQNKGVIGYLASITKAVSISLNVFSSEFYKNISSKNYGEPIGKSIKETIRAIQLPDSNIKEVCLEMVLHGDPGVILNYQPKPDFFINSSKIYSNPYNVTTEIDSFELNVISTNIGMAVNDSIIVEVERTLPDGLTKETYLKKIRATHFIDTISFILPVNHSDGIGINSIKVTLDSYNDIDEISETNNSVLIEVFIKSADIIPIYPYKYAIVPNSQVTLKTSTSYPFSGNKDYVFEIDTIDSFNSPFKLSEKINHSGGIVTWTPPITLTDSMVYFWRVSIDSSSTNSYNWKENSFQHINNRRGWAQAHFNQFKNDKYQFVNYNKPQRKFEFINVVKTINVQTGVYPNIPWNDVWFKINTDVMRVWTCLNQWPNFVGLNFAVFDTINAEPWVSNNVGGGYGPYNNVHCAGYPFTTFDFYTNNTLGWANTLQHPQSWWFEQIENFIDTIPNGYYVLAYSMQNHNAENFTSSMYQAFESIGSALIHTIQNDNSYIIYGRKGSAIGTANEVVGSTTNSVIMLNDSIKTKWDEGFIESEVIGPSGKWISLHWEQKSVEPISSDIVSLSVIGIKTSGIEDTIISGLPPDSTDINNLDKRIDAAVYPYLKLVAFMKDTSSIHVKTPPQLKRWQVMYYSAPETALDPSAHYYFYKDTVYEGDSIVFSVATHNISDFDMDSLLITYWIVDKDRNIHPLVTKRKEKHPSGHILIDTVSASTIGLTGLNSLWIEVNPNNDQFEQYHINNIGEVYFYVKSDKTNPIMDVTFDGFHILDGDIVSSKPMIQIMLNDENEFLLMENIEDTASFRIYLVSPGSQNSERIYFQEAGKEIMRFIPASASNKTCKIEYQADFPLDGTYKLIIQATDKSYNKSGKTDYNINFKVINKSTITEILNWPNPFSTNTRFVFTLTGSEIPTYLKIQIMTITGKIVREIHLDELGTIHIGRNITQYGWDGKDQFGDQLANGIYLYRIITNIKGKEIEKNQTSASQYFTKEFGKMYLLR